MRQLEIYHSADTDDLFMAYGFNSGAVTIRDFDITCKALDIESLNQRTVAGELDVSAASVGACRFLGDKYYICRSGASFGAQGYGPKLVMHRGALLPRSGARLAIPGELTTAAMLLRLYLHEQKIEAELVPTFFEDIPKLVARGDLDGGILIHEGQITFEQLGLQQIVDMGQWWWQRTSGPLPLGAVVISRRFEPEVARQIAKGVRASIEYALNNRQLALDYALSFERGMTRQEADRYISWYVNELTLDMGEVGIEAIRGLIWQAAANPQGSPAALVEFIG